jgi:hypothetical protein
MTRSILKVVRQRPALELADEIDNLKRQAAAIAAGLIGLRELNTAEARGGLIDLALDLSDKLGSLYDKIAATEGFDPKAVAKLRMRQ